MPYNERKVLPEKFKQVQVTFKLRIRELLDLIISGMEFLQPHKSWAESLFIALSEYIKEEDGVILAVEPDFGNMLREIDAIMLETGVTSTLIRAIRRDLGSKTRKSFKDRKLKIRKPMEDLERFLSSN